jgi:hypothetical protein
MGLGAIPQASRLNLGKFRGSRTSELDKVLRPKKNLSLIKPEFSFFFVLLPSKNPTA